MAGYKDASEAFHESAHTGAVSVMAEFEQDHFADLLAACEDRHEFTDLEGRKWHVFHGRIGGNFRGEGGRPWCVHLAHKTAEQEQLEREWQQQLEAEADTTFTEQEG